MVRNATSGYRWVCSDICRLAAGRNRGRGGGIFWIRLTARADGHLNAATQATSVIVVPKIGLPNDVQLQARNSLQPPEFGHWSDVQTATPAASTCRPWGTVQDRRDFVEHNRLVGRGPRRGQVPDAL